jgi:hypothetical protein
VYVSKERTHPKSCGYIFIIDARGARLKRRKERQRKRVTHMHICRN